MKKGRFLGIRLTVWLIGILASSRRIPGVENLGTTDILLRLAHPADPQNQLASDATKKLHQNKDELCTAPQCIYEFWVVATRPTNVNGLGFSITQVRSELVRLRRLLALLNETAAVFAQWEALVSQYQVIGKNAHDTHLVAAMIVHGISHLLTFNKQDFQRFTNITVLTPAEVMAMP